MKPELYRMAKRPAFLPVKRREDFAPIEKTEAPEIVAVDRFTECHVTPADVAARMVEYLDVSPSQCGQVLEPSAGTGNLSRALSTAGFGPSQIVQVERHIRLSQGLHDFGSVANRCFLEYAAEMRGRAEFDRIIMNPPFSDVRKHVAAARDLLAPGGVLVALVPVTFREGQETLETLPPDTFANAKVYTKIIRICRE
ncbi:methyltransferase type 11 [Novosphingobium sp.]|uniref:methyltransferase type 11 n=1 Tax=Novosphingobium sp. TaxID=1874826 RepID=UPI00286E955F|nr:methyltransferase type 11 [Novosphingobium sp.]